MFKELLKFEWFYHVRKPLFYISLVAFGGLGFALGSTAGITFPNVYKNSPYEISYLLGILSLAAIFSVTFSVAESILRESETKFDALLYATPVSKFTYLSSRLLSLTGMAILSFSMVVPGLYFGHLTGWMPGDKIGAYSLMNYLWPLLVLSVPNILLCTAVLCSTAWISRSKLSIYIAGLLIYILYIAGSIFSNSPLIAGSAPASPQAMSLAAKLDPFGMAAFFEQTRYWTALERNSLQLSLSGNFLFNRILWLAVSLGILCLSYSRFSFRTLSIKPAEKIRILPQMEARKRKYRPVETEIQNRKHNLAALFSFIRIDMVSMLKGIPFILIVILWTALLSIEIVNGIDGDPRLGENFASSGLMISTIMQVLPTFALLVMLFYSSELLWRSKGVHFDAIENSSPVHPGAVFLSKLISLSVIPFVLILYSCLMGMIFQVIKGFPVFKFGMYISLFYYLGLPLLLISVLIAFIQVFIRNKYLGLGAASVVALLSCSSVGKMIGIKHPLLRYANTFSAGYADMNGFGSYTVPFHWQMLCWSALAIFLLFAGGRAWNRKIIRQGGMQKLTLAGTLLVFLSSAGFIFYQTDIKYPNPSASQINDWKEAYEAKFKTYEDLPQPTVTSVKTKVDLYPSEQSYLVEAEYRLQNRTSKPIDSLLLYIDQLTTLRSLSIEGAKQAKNESKFGHYWYVLQKPLIPGAVIGMKFSFSSGWSPFKGHTPFNSIIQNGTFIRISNYYPSFGYESGNEISSKLERQRRGMKPQSELTKLETALPAPYDYKFIDFDAVVSTEADQLAIGSGDLVKTWKNNGRRYFHYKTAAPIPFRFAFSSARYLVRKDAYKKLPIEVYYDERHGDNVDKLIADAKKTLAYCEANFSKYPHKVIRFAEVSAFAEGFGATAYPSTIYMKEDGGFYKKLSGENLDVINMLAGHELSHEWWGSAQLAPEFKEGGWILTETLAKYSELVLFERSHGQQAALDKVRQHLDLYLSNRSFSREMPLYKTTFETPHIPYDKGLVVMYQLKELIGEKAVNAALRAILSKHAFPKAPPTSLDLVNEFYKVSPRAKHAEIDELFKQIIVYDSRVDFARLKQIAGAGYEVSFSASVQKYRENGFGKRTKIHVDNTIELAVFAGDGLLKVESFPVKNNKVEGSIKVGEKPVRIVIDPYLKTIDSFLKDNEKSLEGS